jgi:hypothetical protein
MTRPAILTELIPQLADWLPVSKLLPAALPVLPLTTVVNGLVCADGMPLNEEPINPVLHSLAVMDESRGIITLSLQSLHTPGEHSWHLGLTAVNTCSGPEGATLTQLACRLAVPPCTTCSTLAGPARWPWPCAAGRAWPRGLHHHTSEHLGAPCSTVPASSQQAYQPAGRQGSLLGVRMSCTIHTRHMRRRNHTRSGTLASTAAKQNSQKERNPHGGLPKERGAGSVWHLAPATSRACALCMHCCSMPAPHSAAVWRLDRPLATVARLCRAGVHAAGPAAATTLHKPHARSYVQDMYTGKQHHTHSCAAWLYS